MSTNVAIGYGYYAEKEGAKAKSEGKAVEDCPYPKGSIDSFDWLVGYHHGVRK
jgi:ribosome modulation factor